MKKRRLVQAFVITILIVAGFAVAVLALGNRQSTALFKKKVGVVFVSGVIVDSTPTLTALSKFRRNDDIKAVVLRVDSPGGGVAASQEIYREVDRLKRVKPVVCSMGAVAASGGLYISAPCTKIVANPGTLTGSVGVISTVPDMQELFKKIGIRMQVVKTGELKGAGQIDRPLNEKERAMLQELSQEIYEQFVSDLAKARGMSIEGVKAFANGGVFSGQKAMSLGLVDRMGNFRDAIALAAKLGGIKGEPELVVPRDEEENWLGRMLREQVRGLVKELSQAAYGPVSLQYLYHPGQTAQ